MTTRYRWLRNQAEQHLRQRFGRAAAGLTLQPTALAHEIWLQLLKQRRHYQSPEHFVALANTIMKDVLIDYIRKRQAQKRGGNRVRVAFDPEVHGPAAPVDDSSLDVEAILGVIDQLAQSAPRKAEVVRLRLLWGFTIEQISGSLGVSRASVERDWRFARAWLKRELTKFHDTRA